MIRQQAANSHCFNSLQTGKPFRTQVLAMVLICMQETVSIPFKRESPFGQERYEYLVGDRFDEVSIPFKRESPFGHRKNEHYMYDPRVSIPFKRESPFGPLVKN